MKHIIIFTVLLISLLFITPVNKAEAYSRVRGYYKSSGTYVQPYFRSNSNSYKWDNYSSKGNSNPWTGKRGNTKWW